MSLASTLAASIAEAAVKGLASPDLWSWLVQRHPELRTEPWPDESAAMLDARAAAVARIEAAEQPRGGDR